MPSEYDPVIEPPREADLRDLTTVQELFRKASRPYLSSPWSWLAWALLLPAAAWGTPRALAAGGPSGVAILWSSAILLGGMVEVGAIRRRGGVLQSGGLARWSLRAQGNLSLVALALSAAVLAADLDAMRLLPGIWLLALGHSFYLLGGLASRALKACGLLYQLGGVIALWPGLPSLVVFGVATAAGNLWVATSLFRQRAPDGSAIG